MNYRRPFLLRLRCRIVDLYFPVLMWWRCDRGTPRAAQKFLAILRRDWHRLYELRSA